MVRAFEDASGIKIPLEMTDRRAGDVGTCYGTSELAEKELGFKCKYTLYDMCKHQNNLYVSHLFRWLLRI